MSPYIAEDITQSIAARGLSSPPEQRRDARQSDIVASAVLLLRDSGVMTALEYLKTHAIGPQVIERVLLEPGRRRALA